MNALSSGYVLRMVVGAPGSGKSTAVQTLLELESEFVVFDIDWLADATSALIGQDIRFAPDTWKPYGQLWLCVLHAIYQNGRVPVLFSPNDPSDFEGQSLPTWCSSLEWLLLDCDDETRIVRLQRRGWDEARIEEALQDARAVRATISRRVDTDALTPTEVAARVLAWLRETR